jgi:hypothetical protein
MSLEGAARNEELFRNVNEQIDGVSQTVPASEATIEFLCECDQIDCLEKITVTRAEYESYAESRRVSLSSQIISTRELSMWWSRTSDSWSSRKRAWRPQTPKRAIHGQTESRRREKRLRGTRGQALWVDGSGTLCAGVVVC